MIGELYKEEEGYYLFVNTVVFGTTRPLLNFDLVKYKLSLENCEDIERDVPKNDVDGWDVEIEMEKYGYCEGCNKAGMWHCAHADSCGNAVELERPFLDEDGCLILTKNIIQPQ